MDASADVDVDASVGTINVTRHGPIIIIEGLDSSVTFHPNDKDKTFNTLINKLKELGAEQSQYDIRNVDGRLTRIYSEYHKERSSKRVSDAEHLVLLASGEIKDQFRDETGAFYAIIEKGGHKEIVNMDYEQYDLFLTKLFYSSEHKVPARDTSNNAKRLLKSFTTKKRILHNRVAMVDDSIYYDLCDENWNCVKVNAKGWGIVDNPCFFRRVSDDRRQVSPSPLSNANVKLYLRDEIFDKSTIKHDYQKLIAEVYVISLFIPHIAHPMIIPIGPKGSGKTLLLLLIALIVDPREKIEALVQRLPRDEKDRRVNIYNNYLSYFENETALKNHEMDVLCTWVTGYSGTVRTLYTTDESRTYSGKKPIGLNVINIPVSNSDFLSRAFVVEMQKVEDGSDGFKESQLIPENEIIDNIRTLMPEILGHVFDTLVKSVRLYETVRKQIKPNHRLADFVVWDETISRAVGNDENAFLKAWRQNVENQNLIVINNNTLAQLLIGYAFNERQELEFDIEPEDLLNAIKIYAINKRIDYHDYSLPKNPVWLSRQINSTSDDLRHVGLLVIFPCYPMFALSVCYVPAYFYVGHRKDLLW